MKAKKVVKKAAEENAGRRYYLVDAKGEVLGRLAVKLAMLLSGKRKVSYTPNIDNGDFVIVLNADKIIVTGNKLKEKVYTRFSGYSGGFRSRNLEDLLSKRPEEVIRHAVKGMLPKNRLGSRMITRLKVYKGEEHPHKAQKPETITI